jgi:hypothetical protein
MSFCADGPLLSCSNAPCWTIASRLGEHRLRRAHAIGGGIVDLVAHAHALQREQIIAAGLGPRGPAVSSTIKCWNFEAMRCSLCAVAPMHGDEHQPVGVGLEGRVAERVRRDSAHGEQQRGRREQDGGDGARQQHAAGQGGR